MKTSHKILFILCIVIGCALAVILLSRPSSVEYSNKNKSAGNTTQIVDGVYHNAIHDFSFTVPQGYNVREIGKGVGDTTSTETIGIEGDGGTGIQILITPYHDVQNLTAEMIKSDIPDLKISDTQPVEIGYNHTGLAFRSDNSAFDGDSREVWFVYSGNLYQISTYARLDPVLKDIFASWKFGH